MFRYILIALTIFSSFQLNADQPTGGFDDARPVQWNGTPPWAYPVHGVDVARYQGNPDWNTLKGEGVSFAYIKATEGADVVDPSFAYNWSSTANLGIARGAYHFYYFCSSPEAQAAWFIRNVPRLKGNLPPVIDIELNPDSNTCRHVPSPNEAIDVISRFANILEVHYGQRPIIYTATNFYKQFELGRLRALEFWLRSTREVPASAYPGQRWTFWQYSATARIPGVRGNIDVNVFNGSSADWRKWTDARAIK